MRSNAPLLAPLAVLAASLAGCAPEAQEAPCAGKSKGELYACMKSEGLLGEVQAAMVQDPEFIDAILQRMGEAGGFTGPAGTKGEKGETGDACYDAPGVTDVNNDGSVDVLDCTGPKGATGEQGPPGKAPTSTEVAAEMIDNDGIRAKLIAAMAQSGQFKGDKGEDGKDGTPGLSPKPQDVAVTFINDLDLRQQLIETLDQSGLFEGDQGPAGEQGQQGEQGPPGEQGPAGPAPTAEAVAEALVADPAAVAALTGPAGANCWDATGDLNGDGSTNADDCLMKLDGVATETFVEGQATMALKSALCAPSSSGEITGFAPVDVTEGDSTGGTFICGDSGWTLCSRSYQLLNDGSAIASGCMPGPSGWGPDAFVCCEL